MKRLLPEIGIMLLTAIVFFMAGASCQSCETKAEAQAQDVGLLLAKVFVSEGGFDGEADHLAIGRYTRNLALFWRSDMGVTLVRRYQRALAPAAERRGRRWLANLDRSLEAPEGWPEDRQPWSARRAQWAATLARADAFLRREIDAPPGCRPHSWGSPVYDAEEIARTLENGGFVVNCGETKNTFLRWHP